MKQYFREIGQKLWFNLLAIILGIVLFTLYLLFDKGYLWLGFLFSILIIIPAGYRIWKYKRK
ncbi:hypothetical protein [Staphylococcus carnosus]|uniref:Uncharacterized protein n=1 Tax=Staphylococcus carnosus TaxID=1281 RepID=A0AAJ0NHK1_STACA|nr:hypothetical protein [Staphylococcus carnosus]ANZ32424.1 hypothetical protein BEK99_00490 [Staphylococcus carnosus]KKB25770.1 hypothetical protein VV61_04130 [Staphylococcus carnosus]POA05435.1 hypothetical protein CD153_02885 [Staphylococcus carnosus]QPT02819.1 hypothetical protein I6G40_06665 [Staphylococcus carnosus]QQS84295.1 hypothetical protein I6J04_07690 [Staphylococcus carnosus]